MLKKLFKKKNRALISLNDATDGKDVTHIIFEVLKKRYAEKESETKEISGNKISSGVLTAELDNMPLITNEGFKTGNIVSSKDTLKDVEPMKCEDDVKKEEKPIRAIIDGKLYDTDKAIFRGQIGFYEQQFDVSTGRKYSQYREYDLYMTLHGNLFVTDRFNIYTIDEKKVKESLRTDIDKYIYIFGEVEEA